MEIVEIIIPLGIIGFVFVIVNAVMAAILFFTQRQVSTISKWTSTTGIVLTSQIEERPSSEGGTIDHPVVTYSYEVNGQDYRADRIAPGPSLSGTGSDKVVARYPVGSRVSVYYDPGNPSNAVLERKASVLWVWILLIVIDCVLCSAIPLVFWAY